MLRPMIIDSAIRDGLSVTEFFADLTSEISAKISLQLVTYIHTYIHIVLDLHIIFPMPFSQVGVPSVHSSTGQPISVSVSALTLVAAGKVNGSAAELSRVGRVDSLSQV